jgi:hypothetical protein
MGADQSRTAPWPWRDIGGIGLFETASPRRLLAALKAAAAIRPGIVVAFLVTFPTNEGRSTRSSWLDDPYHEAVRQLFAAARQGDGLGLRDSGIRPVGTVQLNVPIREDAEMHGIPATDWLALINVRDGDVWAALHSVWEVFVQSPF